MASFALISHLSIAAISVGIFSVSKPEPVNVMVQVCRGRYETFYDFDYFQKGGFTSSSVSDLCYYPTIYCQVTLIVNMLMVSNVIDMIFIFKIIMVMKSTTKSVANLLTTKALYERKR